MEFLSGIYKCAVSNPTWAICRATQFTGAAGALAAVGSICLNNRKITQAEQARQNAGEALAQLHIQDDKIVAVHKTPLTFCKDRPVKKTLGELSRLLATYNKVGQEAVVTYRGQVERLKTAIAAKEAQARTDLLNKLTALHGALENENPLKAQVKALLDSVTASPALTTKGIRAYLNWPKGDDGSPVVDARSLAGLVNLHNADAFPDVDGLRRDEIQQFIDEKSEALRSENMALQGNALGADVKEALTKLVSTNVEDSPLSTATAALDSVSNDVKKNSPAGKMQTWNRHQYSLYQKSYKVFTSEYPHRKQVILGVGSLALVLFGSAALYFGPKFSAPVVPAGA